MVANSTTTCLSLEPAATEVIWSYPVVESAPGVFIVAFCVQMKSAAVIGVPSLHTASGLMSYVMVMAEVGAASVVVVGPPAVVVGSAAPVVVVAVSSAQAATTSANTNNKRSHRGRLLIVFICFFSA